MSEPNLDSLVETLEKHKNENNSNWIISLVLVILAVAVTAFHAYKAWKAGKERAKLLHEQAVREEEEKAQRLDLQLEIEEQTVGRASQRLEELRTELQELKTNLEELDKQHAESVKAINAIVSWDDVDKTL